MPAAVLYGHANIEVRVTFVPFMFSPFSIVLPAGAMRARTPPISMGPVAVKMGVTACGPLSVTFGMDWGAMQATRAA